MKLACSVEVVLYGVDLKARVAVKTDQSVFNAKSKTPKTKSRNCFSITKQEAKG